MKIITIDFGSKNLRLATAYYYATVFYCEDHDVKTAYDIIADSIVFKDHAYRLVFELLGGDKDVKTFLEDAKEQGFISDYGMC